MLLWIFGQIALLDTLERHFKHNRLRTFKFKTDCTSTSGYLDRERHFKIVKVESFLCQFKLPSTGIWI